MIGLLAIAGITYLALSSAKTADKTQLIKTKMPYLPYFCYTNLKYQIEKTN